jgi:hypothetical protein
MSCPTCMAGGQMQFSAEMIVHHRGLKNLDKPGVVIFPKNFDLFALWSFTIYGSGGPTSVTYSWFTENSPSDGGGSGVTVSATGRRR